MDRRLLAVVGIALLGAAAWFALHRAPPTQTRTASAADVETPAQTGPAAPPSVATPSPKRPSATSVPPTDRQSPLRRVENRFLADPLVPEWAQRNEKVIGDFLAARNLRALNLVVPLEQRVECHSTMCRIALLFPDIDAATQVHERLVLSIGESLPMAQAFTVVHDDGRIELVTFAGDARAMAK
jgi:hypothetical protein